MLLITYLILGSSILTILGFKLANKPADKEHPYGHARYEQIAGIIISLLILSMGVLFAKSSIEKIFSAQDITINLATYLVLGIAILGKMIQMFVYLDFAKSINSQTIKAAAMDSRNDILTTSAVLFAIIIMGIFKINIDAYMGLLVSIFIITSAIKMIKETINPLLGIVPTQEQIMEFKNKILSHDEIKGIHDLVVHNYGVGNDFVTVHAEVPADMDIVEAHDIMDNIEREFKEDFNVNLTIHTDPLDLNNETRNELSEKVEKVLEDFDNTLKIHDFRIVTADTHTNIIFDIIIPFEKNYSEDELNKVLKNYFENEETKYYFVLNIDRPFY